MKLRPEKVMPSIAEKALERTKNGASALYSNYIQIHYTATGKLAPGCNSCDLIAWYKINMPNEFRSIEYSDGKR